MWFILKQIHIFISYFLIFPGYKLWFIMYYKPYPGRTNTHLSAVSKIWNFDNQSVSGCCRVLLKLQPGQIIFDKCHRRCLWPVRHKAWTKFTTVHRGDDELSLNRKQTNKNGTFHIVVWREDLSRNPFKRNLCRNDDGQEWSLCCLWFNFQILTKWGLLGKKLKVFTY